MKYGYLCNLLQKVDALPFEKYDQFTDVIRQMEKMVGTVKVEDCGYCRAAMENSVESPPTQSLEQDPQDCQGGAGPSSDGDDDEEEDIRGEDLDEIDIEDEIARILNMDEERGVTKDVCLWPNFHNTVRELKREETFMGQQIFDKNAYYDGSVRDRSRTQQDLNKRRKEVDVYLDNCDKLQRFVSEMKNRLEKSTFSEKDKKIVEDVRKLADFCYFCRELQFEGRVRFVANYFPQYLQAVRSLPVGDVADISDDEIKYQFNHLCHRLEKCSEVQKFNDSKEIIKLFLDPREDLFVDIEIVMHITMCAAVKLATESVLESLVSVFERHCHRGKGKLKEKTRQDLMEIASNGPGVSECQGLIEAAMNSYWGGKRWHFNRSSDIREVMKDSKVLQRLKKEKSNLPFMV